MASQAILQTKIVSALKQAVYDRFLGIRKALAPINHARLLQSTRHLLGSLYPCKDWKGWSTLCFARVEQRGRAASFQAFFGVSNFSASLRMTSRTCWAIAAAAPERARSMTPMLGLPARLSSGSTEAARV